MQAFFEYNKSLVLAVGAALLILFSSMKFVPETAQAVVIAGGQPSRVANRFLPNEEYGNTGAGIIFRIPIFEKVELIDRRILNLDMEPQQVLSTDQLRLNVDAYARYRIIDPVKLVRSVGGVTPLEPQLSAVLSSVVRQELGRRSFASLLTAERGSTMANIKTLLDKEARKYGAQILDVRIKRADLPDGTPLESAFGRMKTAREQEAATIRAQGQKTAQIIRAEADAEAARIYAEAFGKDPKFYDFYRAMQSYDQTFARTDGDGPSSAIVLTPDNEYLRQFKGQ